jgi:hypothetical protein
MFNVLGEDQDTLTVEGPTGEPVRIAKSGVDPQLFRNQMQAQQQQDPAGPQPFSMDKMVESVGPNINAAPAQPPVLSSENPQFTPAANDPAAQGQPAQPNVPASQEIAASQAGQAPNSPEAPKPVVVAPISSFDKGINQQQDAVQKIGQNAYLEGAKKAAAYQGLSDQMAGFEKQRQQLEAQKAAEMKTLQTRMDQASQEAAKNIPDKDFWADKGTGAKIGAAFAVALGALGSSMTGGQNQALSIINNSIDQDLKRQQQRYNALRGNASDLRDTYGLMLKRYGDQESANLAMQETAYRRAQIKLQMYSSQTDSADAKAKAQQLMGQLEEQRGAAQNALLAKQAERADKMRDSFVPSFGGYAPSKEGADKINELVGASTAAKHSVNELMRLSNIPGASTDPAIRGQAAQTATIAMAQLREGLLKGRSMTDTDVHLLNQIITNPVTLFSLDKVNKARLNNLINQLDANAVNQAKAYGLVPGQQQQPGRRQIGVPRQ